jgi:hypothetical protein
MPMVGDPLRSALRSRIPDEALDLGIALRASALEAPDPKRPDQLVACDDRGTALIFFALRLLKRLQEMATVSAMDLDQYTRAVWNPPGDF